MPTTDKKWRKYEETAQNLLNQYADRFGLKAVEGKQKIPGLISGTTWELDAKGICINDKDFIHIEARQYESSKQTQAKLGALVYSIIDTGAAGGIIVSPLGLQEGAELIAQAHNVQDVRLRADSTMGEYLLVSRNFIAMGMSESIDLSKIRDEVQIFAIDQNGERQLLYASDSLDDIGSKG